MHHHRSNHFRPDPGWADTILHRANRGGEYRTVVEEFRVLHHHNLPGHPPPCPGLPLVIADQESAQENSAEGEGDCDGAKGQMMIHTLI